MSIPVAVLTISDAGAAGTRTDLSGEAIVAWAASHGYPLHARAVVPDASLSIVRQLLAWCDDGDAKLILTTGGTGIGPRDLTREATLVVVEREITGISEAIRRDGALQTPRAALTRGVAGVRGRTLIVNLPGSPAAVRDALATLTGLVDHIAALLRGNTEH